MALDSSGPTSRIYFSQRLRLHYVDWGNPGAPPLLLVHGGRDHCRNWDWVAAALRRDWHVLAPDLRGHGDSQWSPDGNYTLAAFIYDLAQLIHQQELAPVTIIGHSLGGNIALRYAGIYPDNVRRLVAIEGVGASPEKTAERARVPLAERMHKWIEETRRLAGRLPRRYPSIDDALKRMQEANQHLSPEQARHLTQHGVNQNEDGTYSWKFDNYTRGQFALRHAAGRDRAALDAHLLSHLAGIRQGKLGREPRDRRSPAPLPACPCGLDRRCRALGSPRPARRLSRPCQGFSLSWIPQSKAALH